MKNLRIIAVIFLLGCDALLAEDRQASPIVIVVPREFPLRPNVNGKIMRFPDLAKFLADSAKASGRQDPVIIRLEENKDIAVAATVALVAAKTHDTISIEIAATDNGRVIYVIPIAKEGVITKIDSEKGKGSGIRPIDGDPNRVIDDQFRKLQERARGEME